MSKIEFVEKCQAQRLFSYTYSEIKKSEKLKWFLTNKIDLESQIFALFDRATLHQFTKYNNFLDYVDFVIKFFH